MQAVLQTRLSNPKAAFPKRISFEDGTSYIVLQDDKTTPTTRRVYYQDDGGKYEISGVRASLALIEIVDEAKGLYKVIRGAKEEIEQAVEAVKDAIPQTKSFLKKLSEFFSGLFKRGKK